MTEDVELIVKKFKSDKLLLDCGCLCKFIAFNIELKEWNLSREMIHPLNIILCISLDILYILACRVPSILRFFINA